MKWYQDTLSRRYAIRGMLAGLLFAIFGTLIEILTYGMPLELSSIWTVQRAQPLLWIIDTAPLVLGFMAGTFGTQRSLAKVIERGKKEWEAIVDSFSDLILVTDADGRIIRCNHVVIGRLNTTFLHVLGKSITEVLNVPGQGKAGDFQNSENGFSWMGRLYDVSTYPIQVGGAERQNLFILHDITQRVQMESDLSRERNLLRTLIDNLPDRIYVKDTQGRKTISNLADWRASGGEHMQDVVGKSDFDLYPSELANKFWADDKAVLESGTSIINREEPGLDGQGNRIWVMTTKVPLLDEKRQVAGLVGIGRDITNQKKSEEKLRQLSQAVEQSPSTIVITDLDGNIAYANPKFTETTGYMVDEALGKNLRILKSGHTSQEEYKHLWDTIRSGREWHGEFHNRKKNGELYWESATISPMQDEVGKITHFLAVKEDITERKQAGARLEQSETLFRALFDLSPDAIVVIDPHDDKVSWPIIDCNVVACLMNDYGRDELIGQSIDVLNVTSGTAAERIAYMKQLREAGNLKFETHHRRRNGDVFPVEVSTTLIPVGERELVIGIDRDITERRRIATELLREKQFFESLVQISPAAIVVLDNHDKIISCNPAFEELYGYQSNEILGASLDKGL